MRRNTQLTAVAAFFSAALICAPASAGTKDDVRDLQARMQEVERSVAAGSAATVRISELEREIQVLTGEIERLSYELDQANARMSAITAALAGDGGSAVGGGGAEVFGAASETFGPAPAGGPVDLTTGDPIAEQITREATTGDGPPDVAADIALPLDPDAAFDYASSFLFQGDYARAKAAFTTYVAAFPSHPRTPDAKFRLGEIYLALSENAAAADIFIDHIKSYPQDPKAAEAYLKLGTAFVKLDRPTEACKVFASMKSKFPNAPTAVHDRANMQMARADCR